MSFDPGDNRRPAPGTKRPRPAPPAPDDDTGRLEVTHRQVPHTPVEVRFSEPTPPRPRTTPQHRVRARRGCLGGSTLAALALGLIVLALVALALYLPPFSLWDTLQDRLDGDGSEGGAAKVQTVDGLDFIPLAPAAPRVEAEGLVIAAEPDALSESFGVHISALAPADYLAGNIPSAGWFCDTAMPPALPPGHALASRVYSLAQIGTTPAALTVQVAALSDAGSDPAALELNVWNAAQGTWDFLAAGADESGSLLATLDYLPRCLAIFREAESQREVGLTLGLMDQFDPGVMAADVRLYPGSLRPTATGALQVVLAPGFQTGQGYDVLPLLQNFDDPAVIDVATVQRLLDNAALRTEHARQIAAFVLSDPGYAGIVVDYRELPPALRDTYTAFLADLAGLLHSQDRALIVVLPTPIPSGENWDSGAYDWPAIGRLADEIVLMAPLDPQAYAAGGAVESLIMWAAAQVSRSKLILGLNAASVEAQDGIFAPITLSDALSYLGDVALDEADDGTIAAWLSGAPAEFGTDAASHTPYVRYLDADGSTLRTMWITDAAALHYRMNIAAASNLGGVLVRGLLAPGVLSGVDNALLAYRFDQPLDPAPDMALNWIARDGETILAQESGPRFEFDAGDFAGTLTIEALAFGQVIGSQTITISPPPTATPTATPTEPPTTTPTAAPTETPTATPEPGATPAVEQTPVEAPAAEITTEPPPALNIAPVDLSQPLPVVDPALLAGVDLGTGLEVGVQMGGVSSAILYAGRMHATWIKFDVPYRLGQNPADQQRVIDDAQANGFKVLLNVTGDPFEFMGADRAIYITAYAHFVGQLAANGADGIEVWREMNGRMTAEEYVQLLAYAYQAIKTADPATLVISGALRPVAESDDPEELDSAYYARLAEQNIAQYADCIGTQYVIGTVAPSATSGDPRGDNPIYYLSLADDAARAAAGTRPICYTRLGYLSPEGYPPLPEDYTWAQPITAAQQAQWLAEAIQIAQSDPAIRLIILWSLDAGYFGGGSVEAGYAIIRPDDTCPACDLIEPLLDTAGP